MKIPNHTILLHIYLYSFTFFLHYMYICCSNNYVSYKQIHLNKAAQSFTHVKRKLKINTVADTKADKIPTICLLTYKEGSNVH